jgi:hypothetical protein
LIRGAFSRNQPAPFPFVVVHVWMESLRDEWVQVPFAIDTGATASIMHWYDAATRLEMPNDRLNVNTWDPSRVRTATGVGGRTRYLQESITYGFPDDAGGVFFLPGTVLLGEKNEATEELPSILGWDVLHHFEVTLNSRTGNVALEWLGVTTV